MYPRYQGTYQKHNQIPNFFLFLGAGALASLVTQPADVIKTRLQLFPAQSALTAARQIALGEGAGGFLRGFVPRTLRRTLMAALAWTVYEKAVRNLGLK